MAPADFELWRGMRVPTRLDVRMIGPVTCTIARQQSRSAESIDARIAALNARDFKRADEIRAALLAEGIQLMDSKNAAGERITTWEIKR